MSPSPDFGLSFGVYNSDLSAAMVQNGTAVYQGTLTGEAFNFEFEQPGCTCSYAISENWHNNNLPDERASSSPTLSIWGIKGNRQDKSIAPGAVVLYGTLPLVSVSLSAPAVNGLSVTVNSGTSTAAPGASITSISWDWGEGKTTTSRFPARHSYALPGTYTVTVTSTDSDGNTGSASENVTVQ